VKIKVKSIPTEGLEVADKISEEVIGIREEDNFKFVAPLDVRANVEKVESTVLARTNIKGKYSTGCYRCLDPIERDWAEDFLFDFPVQNNTDFIDMDEDIRQEVILNFPSRVLCQEDCQGLCPECGANLNKEECQCKAKKDTKHKSQVERS
jgi:uncharacterized protein